MTINRIARCIFVCLALSLALHGQGTSGNITGQITDPSGLGIPGARVVATNVATNVPVATVATETGNYSLQVYPGTYRVLVESQGFKRHQRNEVIVAASGTVRVDAVLEIGSVTEAVEVSAALLSVQSENAKVSTSVENKMVDELPLVLAGRMRSPYDLVTIAAQVTTSGDTEMSLGGGQMRSWNATLDGLGITTNRPAEAFEVGYAAPSLEAISEFAVDTSGFKAEYGQAAGGVITFSSRSGTNELHGTVYDFLRNQKFDARRFFEGEKAVYKQNDFGAAVGGPVVLPKIYNGRNRTFFHVTYEGFRIRQGNTSSILTVPTPEMYEGDFSNWVNAAGQRLVIYDPGTGSVRDRNRTPFPNNAIPRNRFSAFSQQVMQYARGVAPNRGGVPGTLAYVNNNFISGAGTVLSPQDKGSAKVDHRVSDKHRLGFFMNITRYRDEIGADGPPGLPVPLWNGSLQTFNTEAYRLTHDWVISPRLLNQFQIGGNKFYKIQSTPNATGGWRDKLCFKNVVDCDVNFPNVGFSEFTGWGGTSKSGHEQPMWAIRDDFSYTRGKHAFKFGFSYQPQPSTGFGEQNISGQASFSFLGTGVAGDTVFRSGSSFASFLLGDAQSGATETIRDSTLVYPYFGFYVQDDWRVTRKLTLNLGLRYEPTLPPYAVNDWYSDFDPTRPNPAVNNYPGALRFAGFGEGRENSRTLVDGWYGGFGPRLGLAYAVNSKTTVRAAVGRSFNRVTVTRDSGHYLGFIGRYNFASTDNGITPAFNWDNGLPPYPLSINVDPNAKLDPAFANNDEVHYHQSSDASRSPENLFWNFNIQREVMRNTVIEIGYNASIGSHLMAGLVNINQVPTAIWNSYVDRLGPAAARTLFQTNMGTDAGLAAARAAGIPVPYANFLDPNVQRSRTVNQALRPFPQYLNVVTSTRGNGDHSGHSSYHALTLKATRRYHNGLAMEWNYTFSKLLTDTDSQVEGDGTTQDQYNRRLEKSIGEFDQTHALKLSTVYELPFGRGRRFLTSSPAWVNAILGGWRFGAIMQYASGFPIRITRNNPLPIFNRDTRPVITGYEDWRSPIAGEKFDPAVDRFIDRAVFPAQPIGFGNMTRHNPKLRAFPLFNEDISFAKRFAFTERLSLDFRAEAFNLLNRVRFATGSTSLDSQAFGQVTSQSNSPRRMQFGLKLYW